jgi:hypothetical protein
MRRVADPRLRAAFATVHRTGFLSPDQLRFAAWGAENLARHDLPWATIQVAQSGVLGVPEHGRYSFVPLLRR